MIRAIVVLLILAACVASGVQVGGRVSLLRVERALSAEAARIAGALEEPERLPALIRAARTRNAGRIAWIRVREAGPVTSFRVLRTPDGEIAVASRASADGRVVEVAAYLEVPARRLLLI